MNAAPLVPDDNLTIARLLDGELSPEQRQQLTQRLSSDTELRKTYLRHVTMQAMLQWRHNLGKGSVLVRIDPTVVADLLHEAAEAERRQIEAKLAEHSDVCIEKATRQRRQEEALSGRRQRREIIEIPKWLVYGMAAAVVAGIFLTYRNWPSERQQIVVTPPPVVERFLEVATLTGSIEAEWADPSFSVAVGTSLEKGPYELIRGFAEIASGSGAVLVVEAPVRFEILSRDCVRLLSGKLTGHVPPAAVGFSVNTPLATIVDLGTAFGVGIDEQQSVRLSVFEGEVEAVLSDSGERTILARDRSVAVTDVDGKYRLSDSPIDEGYFVRQLPTLPAYARAVKSAKPFLFWRFESYDEGLLANDMSNDFTGQITPGRSGLNGMREGLMAFESSNSGVVALCDDRQPLPLGNDYTIEFWMNVHREHLGSIVSISAPAQPVTQPSLSAIYVGIGGTDLFNSENTVANRKGLIRFSHRNPPNIEGGTSCYASSRYPINEWQHVVALRRGTAMELYLDGELSNTAEDATATARGLQMHLGRLHRGEPHLRPFNGEIDELAIYDYALEPDVIRKHAKLGRPTLVVAQR